MSVDIEVQRVIKESVGSSTHIGMCCITPVVAAKVLGTADGGSGATLTLGQTGSEFPYSDAIGVASGFGNEMKDKDVGQICVDEKNNIVTTPAYMKNAKPHEVFDGI